VKRVMKGVQAPSDATWPCVLVAHRSRDPYDARRQIGESVFDVRERLRELGRSLRFPSAAAHDRGRPHQSLSGPRQRITVASRRFR
jgi:hypothetical protein